METWNHMASEIYVNEIPLKDTRHSALKIFTKFLEDKKYLYSLYFAKSDDTYYEVINLNHDINIKKIFQCSTKC